MTAENYLVPSGADSTADITETTAVNESTVKPQQRQPLDTKPAHKTMTATLA